jgi:hypothetical protein
MGAWRDLDNGPSHCKSVECAKGELFISRYVTSRRLNAVHNEQARLVIGAELVAGVWYAAQTGISAVQWYLRGLLSAGDKYNAETPVVNMADLTPTQLPCKLFPRQIYQQFNLRTMCC